MLVCLGDRILRPTRRHGIEQVFEARQRAMYACDRARRQLAEARIVQHALQRLQKLLCMLLANLPLRLGGGRCRDALGRRRVEMLFRDLRLARVFRFRQARDDPLQRPFRAVPSYLLDHERAGDGAVADELMNLRRCLLEQADVANGLVCNVQALADRFRVEAMYVAQFRDDRREVERRRALAFVANVAVDHHLGAFNRLRIAHDDRDLAEVLSRTDCVASGEVAVLPLVDVDQVLSVDFPDVAMERLTLVVAVGDHQRGEVRHPLLIDGAHVVAWIVVELFVRHHPEIRRRRARRRSGGLRVAGDDRLDEHERLGAGVHYPASCGRRL
ncbi:Uncharacterised protein [Burkholderia pseudomallei]|nr:Uncharacterised protein [Burkholderia pseudomallei]